MKDILFYLVIGGLVLNALGFLFLNLALRTDEDDEDEYEEYEDKDYEQDEEEHEHIYQQEESEEKYPNATAYEQVQKQPSFFESQVNGVREVHVEMDKAPVEELRSFFASQPVVEEEPEPAEHEDVAEQEQVPNKRKTFDEVDYDKADKIEQEYLEEQKEKHLFNAKHFEPLKYQPKEEETKEKVEPVNNEENVRNHLDAILKDLDNKK